jgi:hypothetical protein
VFFVALRAGLIFQCVRFLGPVISATIVAVISLALFWRVQMRISELSEAVGVPTHTLRRLAAKGVIPARRLRTNNAHWNFARSDVETIRATLIEGGLIEEEVKTTEKKRK